MIIGPLIGLRVIELAAIGPVPFAGGYLADLGAQVLRIDSPRKGLDLGGDSAIHLRGRDRITLDLTDADQLLQLRELIATADVLLEGYRPGTLEKLGLDPQELLADNPRLIVGRMTGWGQTGPMAAHAGHDLNYIAMAGPLRHMARAGEAPVPPLNLVADFGGGAMFLLTGVLSALWERERSGQGQVIDAAMVDGAAYLMMLIYSLRDAGMWNDEPGTNLLDTGAPFYDVYPCADGRYLSVGCLEPKFYRIFLEILGLDPQQLPAQHDVESWPQLRQVFATTIAEHTQDYWRERFAGTDACVYPVNDMVSAADDPHMRARNVFGEEPLAPRAAPVFSRTSASSPEPTRTGEDAVRHWIDSGPHDQ